MDPSSQNYLSDWNAGIFSVPHEELENTHDASELDTKQEKRITIDATIRIRKYIYSQIMHYTIYSFKSGKV